MTNNHVIRSVDDMAHNGHDAEVSPRSLPQPGRAGELVLPPLSEEDQTALAAFYQRQTVLRDLTIGCIEGNHTGAHIFGPPGVSKSYTIINTLRERQAYWRHHQRITAKPLYLELEKHPGAIHVVEDCEQLLLEKSAQTLLRSALGGERRKGRRERRVSYSIAGSNARVLEHFFYGAIIFTSNRPLTDEKPEISAVISRIPSITFAPPDHEIRALMRQVARQVHIAEGGRMSPHECVEVVEYVIQLASELKCRLDLRWIEHGYGHYLTDIEGGGSVDWRDMVKFQMMKALTYFDHASSKGHDQSNHGDSGTQEAIAKEIAIAQEIAQMPRLTQKERVQLWEDRTSLSRPTYYRRLETGRANNTPAS
jgi:hypothetical protein